MTAEHLLSEYAIQPLNLKSKMVCDLIVPVQKHAIYLDIHN